MAKLRIIFFGSTASSVRFLSELATTEEVIVVVTQPDKPAGRKQKLHSTPVKIHAQNLNLPVITPESLTDREFLSEIGGLKIDLGIVVAYGRILPPGVYSIPRFGCVNVHFSLLPKYRGAAPIQWALINGEKHTGVTTFLIDEGLDTGQIYLQKEIGIGGNDDAINLENKLISLGIEAMLETIRAIKQNGHCRPQSGEPSYAPPLKKENGKIDWNKSASDINNLVRGTKPWPEAYTSCSIRGSIKVLKILESNVEESFSPSVSEQPGAIVGVEKHNGFIVKCGKSCLLVRRVQLEGKNGISAWSFWQGARLKIGDKFD